MTAKNAVNNSEVKAEINEGTRSMSRRSLSAGSQRRDAIQAHRVLSHYKAGQIGIVRAVYILAAGSPGRIHY